MLVSKTLDSNEECIRCLLHPLMYSISRKKLNHPAILPAPNSSKVSLLRLKYANDGLDFCIKHGQSLSVKNNEFVGLAIITPDAVQKCNQIHKEQHPTGFVQAEIKYAPINRGEYVDTSIDIDTDSSDIDLPMHADLTYNNLNEEDVKTALRMYANELLKRIKFAIYENGSLGDWK